MTALMPVEMTIAGIGVSTGVAIGPAFWFRPLPLTIPQRAASAPAEELRRFLEARAAARDEMQALRTTTATRTGEEAAGIFEAQAVLLYDPMFEEAVAAQVQGGLIVEAAVQTATGQLASLLREAPDPLLAARALDVEDIGRRLLRILLGVADTSFEAISAPSLVVAQDLTPSDTARFRPELVLGICLAAGSVTSHAAILARTLNIPAVFGLGRAALDAISDQQMLALDGEAGEVVVNPSARTLARFEAVQTKLNARRLDMRSIAQRACVTVDGKRITVSANIGDLDSAEQAVLAGADGIGLLRTEFLFMKAAAPPDEAQQIAVYQKIFEMHAGQPVIVRTLDLGGDKPPRFMTFPEEANPYLGWRGVRVSLSRPDLFRTQMRAVLRAARGHQVQVMFPMIEGVATLRRINALLDEVREELTRQGFDFPRSLPVGAMIETPSAAILAEMMVDEVDFFSIGTNDLTQYTLAVDRDAETVMEYFKPLNPAVLWLVQRVIRVGSTHQRPVSVCGELASIPTAIPILLGMGLERFSVVPPAVAQTKWIIGHFTQAEAEQIAAHALTLPTADEIESFVSGVLRERNLL